MPPPPAAAGRRRPPPTARRRDSAVSQRQPAKAQLGGYLAMLIDHHPELSVDSCYTLVSGPGRYRLIKSEPDECLMEWIGAWDAFKLINAPF